MSWTQGDKIIGRPTLFSLLKKKIAGNLDCLRVIRVVISFTNRYASFRNRIFHNLSDGCNELKTISESSDRPPEVSFVFFYLFQFPSSIFCEIF